MHTRVLVGAWVTEYIQVSMLVNTMLCLNNRYLHIFSHPPQYQQERNVIICSPSNSYIVSPLHNPVVGAMQLAHAKLHKS